MVLTSDSKPRSGVGAVLVRLRGGGADGSLPLPFELDLLFSEEGAAEDALDFDVSFGFALDFALGKNESSSSSDDDNSIMSPTTSCTFDFPFACVRARERSFARSAISCEYDMSVSAISTPLSEIRSLVDALRPVE